MSIYNQVGKEFQYYTGTTASGVPSVAGTTTPPPTSGGMGAGTIAGLGAIMGAMGAIQSGFGAYFSAQSTKSSLKFQADMAEINARMAEDTAQSIMQAGEREAGMVSAKYGQAKASAKVSQASRGIQGGVGSAAEEIASIDLAKETDMLTINANTVRQAWAARTQGVNAINQATISRGTASGINPFSSGATSMINGATSVAMNWYSHSQQAKIASALGVR